MGSKGPATAVEVCPYRGGGFGISVINDPSRLAMRYQLLQQITQRDLGVGDVLNRSVLNDHRIG